MINIIAIIFGIVVDVMGGLIISNFWGWFICPIFMVPHMGILTGTGIMLIYDILNGPSSISISNRIGTEVDQHFLIRNVIQTAIYYIIIFVLGLIFHLCM